jgi:hypothetical protein
MAKLPEKPALIAPVKSALPSTPPSALKSVRGVGYIRDPEDGRDWSARSMLGASRAKAAEAMQLEGSIRGILDQGSTNSCVGHAIAIAADTRLRHIGAIKERPSPLSIYSIARELARKGKGAMVDDGCWPRAAMKGVGNYGVAFERDWPLEQSRVNADVPWDVLQKASAFKLDAFFRVDSVGHSRVEDILYALARGYPVVFGTDIDHQFQDHHGSGVVQPATKDNLGGHMMCLIGYTTTGAGRTRLRGVNSWGTGWGDHGFYWCEENFILDPRAGDFYVCQVSP